MQIHLFRADSRVFGATRAEDGANLPAGFGAWTPFRMVEMNPGETMPGIDVDECLADVADYGFHLTDAHERITHLTAG